MLNHDEESSTSAVHSVGNLTAIDAISERLAEVTRLAEKLDETLYEAGARIRTASKELPTEANTISVSTEENVSEIEKNRGKTDVDDVISVGDIDESYTEDYVTATDCTTTPMARSRSESFVTMSECEDGLAALAAEFFSSARSVS